MDTLKLIGSNIHKLRTEKNITQSGLSVFTGLHRSYIAQIERGNKNVSLANLSSLAKGMNVELHELFEGIG